MSKIKVAIIGASGYSGEELVRLLLHHPEVELTCVTSRQHVGKTLGSVFPQFAKRGVADLLAFSESMAQTVIDSGADCAFLALPHGLASEFAQPLLQGGLKVIDLSADFRLNDAAVYEEYYGAAHPAPELLNQAVYGMPELHRDEISQAQIIASPGCYPTSIILPLVPLLAANAISPDGIVCNSLSGVSGAGRNAKVDYLYAECNESLRTYGIPKHRHLSEIEQELSLAAGSDIVITFTPHLVPVTRGIHTATTAKLLVAPDEIAEIYQEAYGDEPFVRLLGDAALPDTKNVVLSNYLDIAWRHDPRTGMIRLLSAEDNLTKGASGQAVHSMNILYNLEETCGL